MLGHFYTDIFTFFSDSLPIQGIETSSPNDTARKGAFNMALQNEVYKAASSDTLLHKVVSQHQDVCVILSVGVDELSSAQKKLLFEACIDIGTSDTAKVNTFNPSCDPSGDHIMCTILVPGVPMCYLKLDLMESESDEHYPLDALESCVRVFTLMFPSEY